MDNKSIPDGADLSAERSEETQFGYQQSTEKLVDQPAAPLDKLADTPRSRRCVDAFSKYAGTWWAGCSSFFFSLQAICMKSVFSVPPYEMAIVQSGLQALPSGAALLWQRRNPFTWAITRRSGWMLILRGFLGGSVVMLRIVALWYLPIGDCSVILFSSPIFVAMLAPFLLKEPVTKYVIVAIFLTAGGLLLVTQPEFMFGHVDTSKIHGNVTAHQRAVGIGAAFGGAVTAAGISLVLRGLKNENEHVVMFWYGCVAVVFASTITAATRDFRWPSVDWPYILLAGVFQYLSQFTQTLAFQRDSAATISIVRTTEIIWAYLWQVTWFKERVSWIAVGGAVLVLSSVTLVSLERHWKLSREKKIKLLLQQQQQEGQQRLPVALDDSAEVGHVSTSDDIGNITHANIKISESTKVNVDRPESTT